MGAGLCPRRPHRNLPALPRRLLRGQRARPPAPLPQGGRATASGMWERNCGSGSLPAKASPRSACHTAPSSSRAEPAPTSGGAGHGIWYVLAELWERVSAREGLTAICLPYRVAFFAGRGLGRPPAPTGGGAGTAFGLWERNCGSGSLPAKASPRSACHTAPSSSRAEGSAARPAPTGGAGHGIWYVLAELWERVSAREGFTAICLPYRVAFFAGRGLGRPPRSHRGGGPRHLACGSGTVGAGLCPRRLHRDLPAIPRRLLRKQRARPPALLPQ